MKENYLAAFAALAGIEACPGATASVSGNLILGSVRGISSVKGSVSQNSVTFAEFRGISTTGASVTSNKIYYSG